MVNNALLTSNNQDWKTPKKLYNYLDNEFCFDFDPCPPNSTFDGLKISWGKRNYINPPYKMTLEFVKKSIEELKNGAKVCVFLLPARPDTKVFHNYIFPNARELRFIRKRIRFVGAKWDAPFPSMIAVFDGETRERATKYYFMGYPKRVKEGSS